MGRRLLWVSLAVCALVYGPRLNGPLLWDDQGTIARNADLDRPLPMKGFVTRDYFRFSREQSWRPAATLSYAAMIRAFGRKPWAMRGIHLLAHLANGLLLAWLAMVLGLPASAAFLAAALFLAHPAHVETLLCVAFNEEILCAMGLLLMMIGHARRRTALAAGGLALALLSKETGILGLPLVFLYDLWRRDAPWRKRAGAYAVYGGLAAAYLWAYFGPLAGPGGSGRPFDLPWLERAYYALSSGATAVRIFLLPVRLRIEYFALPPASYAEGLLWTTAGAAVAAGWAWILLRHGRRGPGFFLLWPLPFLILTSGLIPLVLLNTRLTAERWMYLPYLGLAAALAAFLHKRPRWALGLLVFWGACGWVRARDWTQERLLWESLLRVYPWCAKAQEGLGGAYAGEGLYPEALAAYERALALREERQDKVLSRYVALSRDGLFRWESPTLYRGLGRTYDKLDRLEEAEASFLKAAALDPGDGYTYDIMAYRFAERGDFARAREWLERGLRAKPQEPLLLLLKPDIARRRLTVRATFD